MDVRGGGFTADSASEGVVGNAAGLEIAAQPDAFRTAGVNGDVNASGVIESHGAMQVGFTHGADGKRMIELLLVSHGQRFQIARFLKISRTLVMLHALGEVIVILDVS